MVVLFIIVFLLFLVYKFFTLKIHIDFKTFFRRGFKKFDNKFRLVLLLWKARKRQNV